MYGQILMINGFIQMYFMVQQSQAMWVLIDACTLPIAFTLTLAQPSKKLYPSTPSAALLGRNTIMSVVGQIVINCIFSFTTIFILFRQSFFKCKEFDSTHIDITKWWELADNYEGEITGLFSALQILAGACTYNLGNRWRLGFWKNYHFLVAFVLGSGFLVFLLVLDPNPIGCLFRINCGTKSGLLTQGYDVNFPTPTQYFNAIQHNVIPVYFRWTLFGIWVTNLVVLFVYEALLPFDKT
jgi:hypothetical protein